MSTAHEYVEAAAVGAPAASVRHQVVAFAVTMLFFAVAPFVLYPVFLMKALCFALFACAFNLLIGYVGLLSFGHAAFLGSAGYVAAHAAKVWGLPPELAILSGTAAAAVLGAVIGALAIRSRGIYFANEWDPKYSTPLESHDPGEPELKGGLLYAEYGKGIFIYTGYDFFRELPAGVPGAYRLFENLVGAEVRKTK